jgi:hypothetical protein
VAALPTFQELRFCHTSLFSRTIEIVGRIPQNPRCLARIKIKVEAKGDPFIQFTTAEGYPRREAALEKFRR